MKIAILGSGAAGSVFAAYLRKGGADDITLVDLYKAHMDAIAEKGLHFTCPEGEFTLTGYKTAYSAENLPVMDIVLLMVKCTQTEGVLSAAQNIIGPETVIVTLQNGACRPRRLRGQAPQRQEHVSGPLPEERADR